MLTLKMDRILFRSVLQLQYLLELLIYVENKCSFGNQDLNNATLFSVNGKELTLFYNLDIDIDKCLIRSGLSCSIM